MQRYVERPNNRDIRLWVFGYQPVCACFKIPPPGQWISNTSTGATLQICPMTPHMVSIGVNAARAVGAEIAGLDIAETPDGSYTILEVNTCPTFLRAKELFGDFIPETLANFLIERATSSTKDKQV
jgi:glutathione synthase/RimK-type ligase-like ATP-grasp enzyme